MQLTFLGATYSINLSSIPVFEGKMCGKYRGQYWVKKHLKEMLNPRPLHRLKYRGVEYIGSVYIRSDLTSDTVASTLTSKQIDSLQATLSISDALLQPSRQQLTDSATSSGSTSST